MKQTRSTWLHISLLAVLLFTTACVIDVAESTDSSNIAAESSSDVRPAGMTVAQAQILASLRDDGPAPELTNEVWLNSEPLTLADLRGNVVIIEFWTYG